MNRGIYATATGMIATQQQLDMVANNLANVSTNGFKRDGLAFADTLERQMNVGGSPIGSLGCGAHVVGQFTIFDKGPMSQTGRNLDVAIQADKGLFAIHVPDQSGQGNPTTMYTRDGSFATNADGQLATKDGYPVLDASGNPIDIKSGAVKIGNDGTVTVNDVSAGRIGVFDGQFSKVGSNMYLATGTPQAIDNAVVSPGFVEGSNVNAIQSMIDLITIGRSYELSQKSMSQQDELTQKLIQSL